MRILFLLFLGVALKGIGCNRSIESSRLQPQSDSALSHLVCVGNEPFWTLHLYKDSLLWKTLERETITFERVAIDAKNNNSKTITATHAIHQSLTVEILTQSCKDSMSGELFEFSATVTWQGNTFSGCAKWVVKDGKL
jgi:uncharacterized membrane protein